MLENESSKNASDKPVRAQCVYYRGLVTMATGMICTIPSRVGWHVKPFQLSPGSSPHILTHTPATSFHPFTVVSVITASLLSLLPCQAVASKQPDVGSLDYSAESEGMTGGQQEYVHVFYVREVKWSRVRD